MLFPRCTVAGVWKTLGGATRGTPAERTPAVSSESAAPLRQTGHGLDPSAPCAKERARWLPAGILHGTSRAAVMAMVSDSPAPCSGSMP